MIPINLLVSEMLAKVRTRRGGTCAVVGALVAISLLLPLLLTGTTLSDQVFQDWLKWSKSKEYSAPDFGGRALSRFNLSGFGQSSSCPLKVYVYDFPRKFNFGIMIGDSSPNQDLPWGDDEPLPFWPHRTGLRKQHSVEYWVFVDLLDKHVGVEGERAVARVKTPEEADLFFVPFFSSLSFNRFGSSMRDPLSERDRTLQVSRKLVSSVKGIELVFLVC
jgi:hypothetical protein